MMFGCGVGVDNSDDAADGDPDPGVGAVTQTIAALPQEFAWQQGEDQLQLGPAGDRFCFLTGVSGSFKGAGESVSVSVQGDPKGQNKMWFLHGTSQQQGVSAHARCMPLSWQGHSFTVGPPVDWTQGSGAKSLGPIANRTCLLTRITGHFQGSGEQVEVSRTGDTAQDVWLIQGASQQAGVGGTAQCVIGMVTTFGPLPWSQGQSPTGLKPVATSACGLTRVSGHFEGAGESLLITPSDLSATATWILKGTSQQLGVSGSAACAL